MSTAGSSPPGGPDLVRTAIEAVDNFLDCMGRGDLAAAATYQADDVVMVFPPGHRIASLAALGTAAAARYRHIDKHRDRFDAFTDESDGVTVYSLGRLFGQNRYGVSFDGVRYVDRFEVVDGLIVAQEVWNDLAESGVLAATDPAELDPRFAADDQPARAAEDSRRA